MKLLLLFTGLTLHTFFFGQADSLFNGIVDGIYISEHKPLKTIRCFEPLPVVAWKKVDTTCIKSRWIALKPTIQNSSLFSTLTDSTSLITFMKESAETGQLTIYDDESISPKNGKWYPDTHLKNTSYLLENNTDPFTIRSSSIIPLLNMYGEDSTFFNRDDFTVIYIYPDDKIVDLTISDITEIRIKENRIYDSRVKEYRFEPVGMRFCIKGYKDNYELFWVDLPDLLNLLEKKNKCEWYSFLKEGTYTGHHYLTILCCN